MQQPRQEATLAGFFVFCRQPMVTEFWCFPRFFTRFLSLFSVSLSTGSGHHAAGKAYPASMNGSRWSHIETATGGVERIGAHFTDPSAPVTEEEIAAILQRMEVDDAIQPQELLRQIAAFNSWLKNRWPDAIPFAEVPTMRRMTSGQLLQGRIDFLLKVSGGWILIDHKSSPGGTDRWDSMAQEYAGQLAAYKDAIEQASGEHVLESWLFLPVAGTAIRV